MNLNFPRFVLATAFVSTTILSFPTLAQYQLQSRSVCRMTIQAQRDLIIREAPVALVSIGSECFERYVQDEMDVLRKAQSPIGNDRHQVIQSMFESAIKGDLFENELPF